MASIVALPPGLGQQYYMQYTLHAIPCGASSAWTLSNGATTTTCNSVNAVGVVADVGNGSVSRLRVRLECGALG